MGHTDQAKISAPGGAEASDRIAVADALTFLQSLPSGCIDLIYVDPPYFTKRDHCGSRRNGNGDAQSPRECGYGTLADKALAFSDRWQGGRAEYLHWLGERIMEARRTLKPSGVFLLHLDWHVVHYAKVLCDQIFGDEAFQNELVWYYQTGGASKGRFSRKHDTILFYAKGPRHYFDGRAIAIPRTEKAMKRARSGRGARIAVTDTHKNPDDVLMVPALNPMAIERTGYPTQKPLALLEKLITALCPPQGTVADVFCGSGTTLVAAKRLGRHYLGCDVNPDAAALARERLGTTG